MCVMQSQPVLSPPPWIARRRGGPAPAVLYITRAMQKNSPGGGRRPANDYHAKNVGGYFSLPNWKSGFGPGISCAGCGRPAAYGTTSGCVAYGVTEARASSGTATVAGAAL